MQSKEQKDVRLKELKAANYNPPNRIEEERTKKLRASMEEIGLLYPILVTEKNEIIDGHRRVAVAKRLGWKTIAVIVATGDRDRIYADVNSVPAKTNGNDALGVWLRRQQAVTPRAQLVFQRIQEALGRPLMERMYKAGLSAATYRMAIHIARYCDSDTPDTIRRVVEWLMKFSLTFQARKAIEEGQSPKVLMKAIRSMRPIKMALSIAS